MKNGKDTWLPLTEAVGEALLGYLQMGRPACACPQVFLTCRAPYRPLSRPSTVAEMVFRYMRKAGIDVPRHGAHTFAVTRLLAWYREGCDVNSRLPALATYLGHVDITSTQCYLHPTAELLAHAHP